MLGWTLFVLTFVFYYKPVYFLVMYTYTRITNKPGWLNYYNLLQDWFNKAWELVKWQGVEQTPVSTTQEK